MYDRKSSISKILQNEEDFGKAWGTRKPSFFDIILTDFGDMWFGFSPTNLAKGLRMDENLISTNHLIKHMFRGMHNIDKKLKGRRPEKKVTIVIAGDRSTKASRPKSHLKHTRKERRKKSIVRKGKTLDWDGKSPLLYSNCPIPDWETLNADPKSMSRARNDCVALMLLLKEEILPGYRIIIDVPCNLSVDEYRHLFPETTGNNIEFPNEPFKFPCAMERNDRTGRVEVHHIPELEHAHAEADHSFQWFMQQLIENELHFDENKGYVLEQRSNEEQMRMHVKVKSKDIDNLCLSAISEEQRFFEMDVYKRLRQTEKAMKGANARRKNKADNLLHEKDIPQRIYVDHSLNKKTKICNITKLSLAVRRRFLMNDEIRKGYEEGDPKAMAIVENPMRNLMAVLYAAGSDWVEGCTWVKTERFFNAFMEFPSFIGPVYDPSMLNQKLSEIPTMMEEESTAEMMETISDLTLTENDQASIRTLRKFYPDVVSGMSFESYTRLLYFATLKAVYPKNDPKEMSFSDILRKNCYNPTVEEAFGRYMRVCYYYIMALYCHFIRVPIFDNYEDFCWKEEVIDSGYKVAKPCPMKNVKNGKQKFWDFASRRRSTI